jgi:hypothetical protein
MEFTEEPGERPCGMGAALRDPSGSIRLTQVYETARWTTRR